MSIPSDAQGPTVVLLDQQFDVEALASTPVLDVRNVGPSHWGKLVAVCRARELRLYHLTIPSLDGIQQLRSTTNLALEWANKITTLRPVFDMSWLKTLWVYDLPKVRSLDGIESLQGLTELRLSGNRGSLTPPLRVESLAPVAALPRLERFALQVARLDDDDLTPLASIRSLRHLELSNRFDRTQFAFLAKRLNPQLEEPIQAYVPGSGTCGRCGAARFMFRGRRQPFLCKQCDAMRFDRLTAEFDALVAAAPP